MAPASQLCGSEWGGFRKELMASAHPDARHFSLSQYATGATPVLDIRESESQ